MLERKWIHALQFATGALGLALVGYACTGAQDSNVGTAKSSLLNPPGVCSCVNGQVIDAGAAVFADAGSDGGCRGSYNKDNDDNHYGSNNSGDSDRDSYSNNSGNKSDNDDGDDDDGYNTKPCKRADGGYVNADGGAVTPTPCPCPVSDAGTTLPPAADAGSSASDAGSTIPPIPN